MKSPVFAGLAILAVACGDTLSPGLASLQVSPDSALHFPVIGDTVTLKVTGTDRDGRSVPPGRLVFISRDPAVARVDSEGRVESSGDGATHIIVEAGGLADSVLVSVAQARDSLVVTVLAGGSIVSIVGDTPFPLSCRAFDASGTRLALVNSLSSRTGTVSGSTCESLTADNSGHDTLDITAGAYQVSLPIVVAVRPVLLSDPSIPLEVDSLPSGIIPWAPTLVKASSGDLHLYFAGYRDAAGHLGGRRGDLHRLVSADGAHFQYDGIVLRRDDFPCSPRGTGIENVAIVPRSDDAGWRMFYAAGGDECGGWQVFSAVSDDEETWTAEPGIRIPNGSNPRRPAGEGMQIDLLPSGTWRMLVGSYERVTPPEDRFQITEWTSPDQLSWSYGGAVLTTRQVGPAAARSVYSPTVTDIAPGLQRMFFTGDNLDLPGGASRIYSAVSVDGAQWQVEGVVLGGGKVDYFYSSFADSVLVFIRSVSGAHALGIATIGSR